MALSQSPPVEPLKELSHRTTVARVRLLPNELMEPSNRVRKGSKLRNCLLEKALRRFANREL